MSDGRLPLKLETQIAAWLNTNRTADFAGLHIAGAHAAGELIVPWLSVWCTAARTHPDFSHLRGTDHPQLACVEFTFRVHKTANFAATAGKWSAALHTLLAYGPSAPDDVSGVESFAILMAALNQGGSHHPVSGLRVYDISLADDSLGFTHDARTAGLSLEITAQNRDVD